MPVETLFQAANLFAFVGWIALIVAPDSRMSRGWVRSGHWALVLAFAYLVALAMYLIQAPVGANLSSVSGVRAFFSSDWGVLAGWIHYLCFDMLVGIWIESRYRLRNRWLRAFVLALTFLLGPVGWSLAWFFDRKKLQNVGP